MFFGAALSVASATLAGEVPLTFGTDGGDAWDFSKSLEVFIPKGRCDHVKIISPRGATVLAPDRGHVRTLVRLQPGDNQIMAECREHGVAQGMVQQKWQVKLRNAPTASIRVSASGGALILDARASAQAPVGGSAITSYEWRARDGNPALLANLPYTGERIAISALAKDGEYIVILKVTDAAGRSDESAALLRSRNGRLRVVDTEHDHAGWIDHAVVYGVVPPLFGPRGLADVTERLDQLSDLGVTALWLAPITESPPGDFGYAVTDYFHLRRSLGAAEDLSELVRAAHARGMRVMMDFVPNHVSEQHAYFTDTITRAGASPYFNFFARDHNGKAEHYFDWSNLKNLNYGNPEVQRLIIEAFEYWIREFDIDGFRVDAAWGPRQRAPDFWPRWRRELKRIKPDLLLLAEASAHDAYYGRNGFDAAYDWTDKLGEWAWQAAFEDAPNTARRLRSAIEASASDTLVFRFLENNDTGPRFRSRYGFGRTRVATAMLLTLPGIPCLYTGEEVGAAYEPYKNAHPISWDDIGSLRGWYKRLIALRHDQPALGSRDLRMLDIGGNAQVLAYIRGGNKRSDGVLVILNYGGSPAEFKLCAEGLKLMQGRKFVDLLTGDEIIISDGKILLAGQSARILKAAQPQ
jgi:cyclomaltodextrinase / maltogenic alpha-amylase / neopullulanase